MATRYETAFQKVETSAQPKKGRFFNQSRFLTMSKRDVHVVPHSDGWATRKEGSERAGGVYDTQREAINHARDQAKRERVEVVIHREDGRIRNPNSYGNDPMPPRDKKN